MPEQPPESERTLQQATPSRSAQFSTELTVVPESPGAATVVVPSLSGPKLPSVPGFEILGELGRGGMGVVYKARHLSLNRTVALKMILGGGHAGSAELARFLAEAQAMAQLQHPNIVQVFEIGQHDGLPYFALEYLDGGGLNQKLAGQPLPPRQAASLLRVLAEAIAAAHQKGIVHRDLKPANVLLSAWGAKIDANRSESRASGRFGLSGGAVVAEFGTPKVTDFGLAKRSEGGSGITQSGDVLGTPSYMPPEQAQGKTQLLGPAADIYSLGAILYECLTGRPPFRAATVMDTLRQVLHDEPVPPSRLTPRLPRDLETICLTCLHKEPRKRYATAEALADDLQRYLDGEPIQARRLGALEKVWRRCKKNPVIASLLLLTALTLVGGVAGVLHFAVRASNNARDANEAKEFAEKEKKLAEEATEHEAAARKQVEESADRLQQSLIRQYVSTGTYFVEGGDRASGLWSYQRAWQIDDQPATQESHRLRLGFTLQAGPQLVGVAFHRRPVLDASFDPEAKRVLTRTDEPRAYLWDPFTSRLLAPLEHGGVVRAARFRPTGKQFATGADDGSVRFWDAETGKPIQRWEAGSAVLSVAYRPDGDRLAVATEKGAVRFIDAATGEEVGPKIDLPAAVYHVAYSADGRRIVTADTGDAARVWDAETGEPVTPSLPHFDHRRDDEYAIAYRCLPTFTPDGKAVATVHPNVGDEAKVTITDLATGKPRFEPIARGYWVHEIGFKGDGSLLVVHCGMNAFLFDAKTGKELPSLPHPRETPHGAFRPDGARLATCSTGGLVHQWDLASGRQTDPPLRCGDGVHSLSYTADGKLLLVASDDGTARVWRVGDTLALQPYRSDCGRADRLVRKVDGELVRLSPGGERELHYNGPAGVRLLPRGAKEGMALDHPRPVGTARFAPDGKWLLTQDQGHEVRVWSAESGRAAGPPLPLKASIWYASFGDGGRRLLTVEAGPHGNVGRAVTVWDVATGKPAFGPMREWDSGPQRFAERDVLNQITRAALSPDGKTLALASEATGALGVFDVDAGKELARTRAFRGHLAILEFGLDGKVILTNGSDTVARLWDARTVAPAGPPLKHARLCGNADLAADGRHVLTVDLDLVIRLWDGLTGDPLGRLDTKLANNSVWFSADGKRLILNGAQSYDLPTHRGPRDDLPALLRLLTGLDRDADETVNPIDAQTFRNDPNRYREVWCRWRGVE